MARVVTAYQRRKIEQAIRDGHLAFTAELLGPAAISRDDYARLKRAGKIRADRALPADVATAAHALGAMLARGSSSDVGKLSPEAFWRMMREDTSALPEAEREAVSLIRDRLGQYIKGLGDKLDAKTGHLLVDADDRIRRKRLGVVRREVSRGIEERAAGKEVARRMREATGDVRRDWLRIAETEMHNGVEEAKAVVLAHEHGGDPNVFKRPRPDACPFCVLLYLKPDKKTPRVFKLSELVANGTNVGRAANRPTLKGRRATAWKAVLGAMHPFCQCGLHHLPPGMGFNAAGEMIYLGVKKAVDVETLDRALLDHVCTTED